MNIGIDFRPLEGEVRTGVGEFAFGILDTLFRYHPEHSYYLLCGTNAAAADARSFWNLSHVHMIPVLVPAKILHTLLAVFHLPALDQIISKTQAPSFHLDWWYSPNLLFTHVSSSTKHLLTIHDLSFELFPKFLSCKRRYWHALVRPRGQCEQSKHIVVPSESTKRDLIDLYNISPEKITVVYPGVEIFSCSQEQNEKVKRKYRLPHKFILFLGTIEPRKNIIGIIEAYKKIREIYPQYGLVLAGAKGWKDGRILSAINKTPGVIFLGYIDAKEKTALLSLASVFVYPSWYEGFGFPILEAMAAGTPVVTSSRSSLPEIAGGAAYLVNPMNINELKQGVLTLLGSDETRARQIECGRKRACEFVWEQAGQKMIDIFSTK